jgi:hypothetical protein
MSQIPMLYAAIEMLRQQDPRCHLQMHHRKFTAEESQDLVRLLSDGPGIHGGDKFYGTSEAHRRYGPSMVLLLPTMQDSHYGEHPMFMSLALNLDKDITDQALNSLDQMIKGQSCLSCKIPLGWKQWELPLPSGEDRLCGTCVDKEVADVAV